MVRDFRTQIDVFEKFTIAGTDLSDPLTAFAEIDRVLDACDRFKRPVYIELPRDMVHVVPPVAHGYAGVTHQNDPEATAEAIRETVRSACPGQESDHRRRSRDSPIRFAR